MEANCTFCTVKEKEKNKKRQGNFEKTYKADSVRLAIPLADWKEYGNLHQQVKTKKNQGSQNSR